MATVHVDNVPDALYAALRTRARNNRRSIAAEVLSLLEANVPTATELKRRRAFVAKIRRFQAATPTGRRPFPSAERMQRLDRQR